MFWVSRNTGIPWRSEIFSPGYGNKDGETLPIDKWLGLEQAAGLVKNDVPQPYPGKEKAGIASGALKSIHRDQIHCQVLTAQGAPPRLLR